MVTYVFFRPMHLSDNLAKLAQLIDFGKSDQDNNADPTKAEPDPSPTKTESKTKQVENKQSKPWPWEWLRTSLV